MSDSPKIVSADDARREAARLLREEAASPLRMPTDRAALWMEYADAVEKLDG